MTNDDIKEAARPRRGMRDDHNCASCAFSVVPLVRFNNERVVECRRFPPANPSRVRLKFGFPLTHPKDWCAEHKEAEG